MVPSPLVAWLSIACRAGLELTVVARADLEGDRRDVFAGLVLQYRPGAGCSPAEPPRPGPSSECRALVTARPQSTLARLRRQARLQALGCIGPWSTS